MCFHKHVFRRVLGVDFVDVVLGLKVSSLLFGHGRDSLLQVRLLFEILFDLFVTLAHVLQSGKRMGLPSAIGLSLLLQALLLLEVLEMQVPQIQ